MLFLFHVSVAFLWVLWFPPVSQKHASGYTKLPPGVNVYVNECVHAVQDGFAPSTQCSSVTRIKPLQKMKNELKTSADICNFDFLLVIMVI